MLITVCVVHAQDALRGSLAFETETSRRAKLAERNNDRSEMPFLEATSLSSDTNTFTIDREYTGLAYTELATAEECAAFLPKIFPFIRNSTTGLSGRIVTVCLDKITAAIAARELPEDTVGNLLARLVIFTQDNPPKKAILMDDFLIKHCVGYEASWQRLVLWTRHMDLCKSVISAEYLPQSPPYLTLKSIEAIPPAERVDLRGRFPGQPPLPEEMAAELEAAKVTTEETEMPTEDEDPPPYLWPAIAFLTAILLAAAALILRKAMK